MGVLLINKQERQRKVVLEMVRQRQISLVQMSQQWIRYFYTIIYLNSNGECHAFSTSF